MHFLTRQRLHLSLFHPLMKILLSLYILSVGAGLWVATQKYADRAEWSAQGVEDYVAGELGGDVDEPFGNPYADSEAGAAKPGKSRRELIDIAHPHLFSIPIVLFVLGHLLHLTRLPDWLKGAINIGAFVSFLGTFLLPFVVTGERVLAPLLFGCGWLMLVSTTLLCVVPAYEMWFGRPGAKPFDAIPKRARPSESDRDHDAQG